MNPIISRIPLETFLKIWGLPLLFNILGTVFELIGKFEHYKNKLRTKISKDIETGVPYIAKKSVRKLLKINDKRYLLDIYLLVLFSFIFGIAYIILSLIFPASSKVWLENTIVGCCWIAIISNFIAIFALLKLFYYLLRY